MRIVHCWLVLSWCDKNLSRLCKVNNFNGIQSIFCVSFDEYYLHRWLPGKTWVGHLFSVEVVRNGWLLLNPQMWATLPPAAFSAGSCFGQLIVKRYFVNIEAVPWAIWRHRCNRILLWSKILQWIAPSEKLWTDWTWKLNRVWLRRGYGYVANTLDQNKTVCQWKPFLNTCHPQCYGGHKTRLRAQSRSLVSDIRILGGNIFLTGRGRGNVCLT